LNSKSIQILNSIFLGILGLTATFFPNEILNNFGIKQDEYLSLVIQIIGALYLGFALTNWLGKTILVGGIYGKALYMGNFAHFLIGGLVLLKWNLKNEFPSIILIILLIGYLIFALLYALNLFRNPSIINKN